MKILLDTHILLWTLLDKKKVEAYIDEIVCDENDIYFSLASLWEIEIKHNSKPDNIGISGREMMDLCYASGFMLLPLLPEHIFATSKLSRPDSEPLHKDPFDKMLIAQAKIEGMVFVTHDSLVAGYSEPCIKRV